MLKGVQQERNGAMRGETAFVHPDHLWLDQRWEESSTPSLDERTQAMLTAAGMPPLRTDRKERVVLWWKGGLATTFSDRTRWREERDIDRAIIGSAAFGTLPPTIPGLLLGERANRWAWPWANPRFEDSPEKTGRTRELLLGMPGWQMRIRVDQESLLIESCTITVLRTPEFWERFEEEQRAWAERRLRDPAITEKQRNYAKLYANRSERAGVGREHSLGATEWIMTVSATLDVAIDPATFVPHVPPEWGERPAPTS